MSKYAIYYKNTNYAHTKKLFKNIFFLPISKLIIYQTE